MFRKDLSNIQKDTEFINKNKRYYSGQMYKSDNDNTTHEQWIDDMLGKFKKTTNAQDKALIDNYNQCVNKVITSYRNGVSNETLAKNYAKLVDAERQIRQKLGKNRWDNAFKQIKYAKGPSIEKRSNDIWSLVTPILGKTYMSKNKLDIVEIRPKELQIKNLTNDTRMGLKNYFSLSDNAEETVNKAKESVFVIFDDNISGGATLSDICMQCKKCGIDYIVPITFGEMRQKYNNGMMQVNKPTKSGRFENY